MLTFYHGPQPFHDDGVWHPIEALEYVILNYPQMVIAFQIDKLQC
jgi:hypothetical protein